MAFGFMALFLLAFLSTACRTVTPKAYEKIIGEALTGAELVH